MDIKKIIHTKCPNCQKQGISFFRGIGYRSTYIETCKYCKKKYRVNPALVAVLKIGIPLFFAIIFLIIKIYVINFPNWVIIPSILLIYYIAVHFCPMESVGEKTKNGDTNRNGI